jgi:glycosyltransferase involved in cell wall biosynthesis
VNEIALVSSYIGGATSGASKAAADMLIAALLLGYEITVISNTGKRLRLPAQVNGQMVPSPRWLTPSRPFPKKMGRYYPRQVAGWLLSAIQDPQWARRLRQLSPPDLTMVYAFNQDLMERVSRINPRLKQKTALVIQGSPKEETFEAIGRNLDWAVEFMANYDYLIFASSRCQQDWLSLAALADKTSFYIPNCCDEDVVANLMSLERDWVRRRLGIPNDQLVVVCVASVQYRKGQDLLLKYLPDFMQVAPDALILLIGPTHSNWAQSFRRQVAASPHSNRLKILGTKTNAMDFIYAADLLVLPSRAEAMPLTILEAMALRTPVVASDVDGIPELIEHGQSGLLFSHDKPEGLVGAFEQMATNPDLRRTFAERAHQRYWADFSRAQQIIRYDEALKEMLNQPADD